jgi:phosphohistidine swiveling domain-containing protein
MHILTDDEIVEKALAFTWERWLERPFSPFMLSLFTDGMTREAFGKIGVPGIEADAFAYENHIWYRSDAVFDHMEELLKPYLETHSMPDVTESLEKFRETSRLRLKKLIADRSDPLEKLEIVREILSLATTYIWLAHGIEHFYDKKLRKLVPQYVEGDVDLFIGDASFPSKKNEFALMEEAIERGDDPEAIVERFGWLKVRDGFSDPFTVEDILQRKHEKHDNEAPRKEVEIPAPLREIFSEVRELVYYRTHRTDVFYELLFVARPIITEAAEKYGISFQDAKSYPIQSLIDGSLEHYPADFSCVAYGGRAVFLTHKVFHTQAAEDRKEFPGKIAQKGCVRGIVKVVRRTDELGKVEEGDVFVTQMTVPAFIVAMNRAAAFVTDEGGITCHAAIIAREMKKPCIIGTKVATRVLHDGDLVEVDADSGVVRIIERAE